MADLSLLNFTRNDNGINISVSIDVITTPYRPVTSARAVIEQMRSRGVNGYRSRLIHRQPPRIRVAGIIGVNDELELDNITDDLYAIDGSYGTAEFLQGGATQRIDSVQIVNVNCSNDIGQLLSAGTSYQRSSEVTFTIIPQI